MRPAASSWRSGSHQMPQIRPEAATASDGSRVERGVMAGGLYRRAGGGGRVPEGTRGAKALACRGGDADDRWHEQGASFDRLRMRESLSGTKKRPHPELVERRRVAIPAKR